MRIKAELLEDIKVGGEVAGYMGCDRDWETLL